MRLDLLVLLAALHLAPNASVVQGVAQAPPAQPATPPRLIRSVSGSQAGEQSGTLIIQDPRTTFYVPDDKSVVVYFEWEGQAGPHRFEGLWKDPSGRVAAMSNFDYEAKQPRFGASWQLNLSEQMQRGWWSLEARVDGQSAGSHSFEVVAAARPELPARRVLGLDEIYQRALRASMLIEKLDAAGKLIDSGLGFRLAPDGLVVTAFHNVDGAAALRMTSSQGSQRLDSLLAWDRRRDFALLRLPTNSSDALLPSASGAWKVGDRVFALDVPTPGNRVIVEGYITGRNTFPDLGERLNISFSAYPAASGGPLLNEYGEVLGIMQRPQQMLPGSWSLRAMYSVLPIAGSGVTAGSIALPLSALPNPAPANPTSFAELFQQGVFVPPLVGSENVMLGRVAREVMKGQSMSETIDERSEFRRQEGSAHVVVTWNPKKKGKYVLNLRIFDLDNRPLFTAKPQKIGFSPNDVKVSSWKITFGQLPAGIYRVDVLLNETPAWRTFFRLTE